MSTALNNLNLDDRPRSKLARYGVALAAIVVATVLRYAFDSVLGGAAFALYFAAVAVAAWYGGLGPCFFAQFLTIAILLLTEPPKPEPEPAARVLSGLGAFFFVGIAIAILSESTRAAQRRARAEAAQAVLQREQLRTTLSCIADAVIVVDNHGCLTMMNRVAESLTGWAAPEAVARALNDVFRIVHEGSGEVLANPINVVLRARSIAGSDHPVVLTSNDGSRHPIDYRAAPIQDAQGHVTGAVLTFRDVTQQRRTEQALRESDRRKDEFLALLAHELRNPLAPIGNALQILKIAPDDQELLAQARVMMQRQFEHLVRLVDDLLDVSRIARGKVELRPTDTTLDTVMLRAVEAARPLIDEQEHTLTVDLPQPPLALHVDPVRLAQVITNLLTNSAKYMDRGGSIDVCGRCEGADLVLSVRDTGIGIPPEMLPRIFEMFMQLDQGMNRAAGGLGIGLTLVKSIVAMHGGQVEVHSEGPGKGSEFIVRLPLSATSDEVVETPSGGMPCVTDKERSILVVDDNEDSAKSLACLLKARRHRVEVAHSGLSALHTADQARPEIVILDLGMPGMDGYEVAEQLRARAGGDELILVALTGWGGPEDRKRTQVAGFDYHFVKPVKMDDLDLVIAQEQRVV